MPESKDKVKVFHMESRYPSEAKNRALEIAKGEWIWFVNSKDSIVLGSLATIKERMRMTKGELYTFQYIKADENGNNPEKVILRENQELIRIKNDGDLRWHYTDRLFAFKDSWDLWSRLFNGNIIRENGLSFPDSRTVLSEDLGFLMEYMMFVNRSVMLVNSLYNIRQVNESTTYATDQKSVILKVVNLLEDIFHNAERYGKKQLMKEYDLICAAALENQIHYQLSGLSDDEIYRQIIDGINNKTIGKYIKKAKKRLITAIYKTE